jgi:uncharacterized membrane protein
MLYLILGLLLFLGSHSLRIVADPWRQRTIARVGVPLWRAAYSLVAVAGFVLIVKGYGANDTLTSPMYQLPEWSRLLTIALMLPAAVLLVAAYVPGTHIKQAVGHPMMLGTRIWAAAHLLSNGRPADVLLFGSFFAWSVFAHHAARRRDRENATAYPAKGWSRDAIALGVGAGLWVLILVWGHRWVGGVSLL